MSDKCIVEYLDAKTSTWKPYIDVPMSRAQAEAWAKYYGSVSTNVLRVQSAKGGR